MVIMWLNNFLYQYKELMIKIQNQKTFEKFHVEIHNTKNYFVKFKMLFFFILIIHFILFISFL